MTLIGREPELRLVRALLRAGGNLLLEGPVGVGKTRLMLESIAELGRPWFRVDGDERFTEQKMAGWFDPAAVMKAGYVPEHFVPGPLHRAMTAGGILFINEINRLPESVQNLLLPALDERLLQVPMIGSIEAAPGFEVVATMNPREFIATTELSEALRDRFELLVIDYQSEPEERAIVAQHVADLAARVSNTHAEALIAQAVALTRATRQSPAFRRGASVRAAISMVRLALELGGAPEDLDTAARMALGNRVELAEDASAAAGDPLAAWLAEQKKKPLTRADSRL